MDSFELDDTPKASIDITNITESTCGDADKDNQYDSENNREIEQKQDLNYLRFKSQVLII